MEDLSYAEIVAVLKYEKETGRLIWRPKKVERGEDARLNAQCAGKEAGSMNGHGYLSVKINGKAYRVHRVVWMLNHKVWPSGQVDHINGVRTDNRIENLRETTASGNMRNQKLRVSNKTGVTGVKKTKNGAFVASIKVNGKDLYLGTFQNLDEAKASREAANLLHGFLDGHGKVLASEKELVGVVAPETMESALDPRNPNRRSLWVVGT